MGGKVLETRACFTRLRDQLEISLDSTSALKPKRKTGSLAISAIRMCSPLFPPGDANRLALPI